MSVAMTPLYFESGVHTLFGWLHQPSADQRTDIGLVLCKPFGYEAICAHLSLRAFADACAATGVTVLRFDYSSTGDSSGADSTVEQMAQWTDDTVAAIETLRRAPGVRRICVLGIRLGAMLAALAAAKHEIDALIAVAPVVEGRRYLRELRAYQAAVALDSVAATPDGSLEVTGFTLSAASVDSLARMDLKSSTRLPAPTTLILDRSDLPGAKPWADALLNLGADVRYRSLPGFAEMVSTPHAAKVPQEMVLATVEWLKQFQAVTQEQCDCARTGIAATTTPSVLAIPEAVMRLTADDGSRLVEHAFFVDEQRTLFAIVTAAAEVAASDTEKTRYGVVMLNGGATSHIGPNRMNVEIARHWAARGYIVLRLDLAGLGDSATRPGRTSNEVYPPEAVVDIATAIEYLRRTYGVDHITLAGLCAGAYHALCSAREGLPVNALLLINPLTFYHEPGTAMSDLHISEVIRNPGVYGERVMVGEAWLKLLRGRVNLWRVGMVFVRRALLSIESSVRYVGRLLNIHLRNDLGWDLQSVAARGVQIVFLFARGDAGAALLTVQGGAALKGIGDRCRIHMIDDADHIFSQSAARKRLVQLLSAELPQWTRGPAHVAQDAAAHIQG